MENNDQGRTVRRTDARCNALDLFKSNGSRMERARHKLEITPPQRAVRIRIPAHIVLLGYGQTSVGKAGKGESEIVVPIASYDRDRSNLEIFTVKQGDTSRFGRRYPIAINDR
jgi:hypothetical protein